MITPKKFSKVTKISSPLLDNRAISRNRLTSLQGSPAKIKSKLKAASVRDLIGKFEPGHKVCMVSKRKPKDFIVGQPSE